VALETLASGSPDETIKLWNVSTRTYNPREFRGQLGAVWSLAFSPNGHLASGSRDSTVKIWNLAAKSRRDAVTGLNSKEWGNFVFSPDSKWIAAGCQDNTVKVWEVETLKEVNVIPKAAFAVAFSPDGKVLLVSTRD